MGTGTETLRLLLVSGSAERGALLQQFFRQRGLRGELQRIDPGRAAIARALRTGPRRDTPPPDLVLLDFAAPDRTTLSIARQLGVGQSSLATPVVLLTSQESEAALGSGALGFDDSRVFAPTELDCFADNIARQPHDRVVRALSILSGLGPILVRLPKSLARGNGGGASLTA